MLNYSAVLPMMDDGLLVAEQLGRYCCKRQLLIAIPNDKDNRDLTITQGFCPCFT